MVNSEALRLAVAPPPETRLLDIRYKMLPQMFEPTNTVIEFEAIAVYVAYDGLPSGLDCARKEAVIV